QARYYGSAQGRFTSPDSFFGRKTNPQTLNLYAYVLNNPLKWADPTGHFVTDGTGKDKNKDRQGVDPKCIYDVNCIAIGSEKGFFGKILGGLKKIGRVIGTGLKVTGNAFFGSGAPMGFESDLPAYVEHKTGVNPSTVAAGVLLPEVGGALLAEG